MNGNGYRETEIGLLPSEWDVRNLGELFQIKQGKSLSPKHRQGMNPKPFLRTANVLWGKLDLSTLDHMDFTIAEMNDLRLTKSDLLVCEGGEIGRTAIWKGEPPNCLYQNHLHRLRRRSLETLPLFYMYWMQAAFLVLNLYGGYENKTTIPNLSQARLKTFPLPCPPLSEQKKIAFILSGIQQAIEVQEKIIERTKELKNALMMKLFTEGLYGEELKETEIGSMPMSWDVKELGEIATLQRGRDLPKQHWTKGKYPIVGSNGIIGFHNEYFLDGKGVVTGRSGTIGQLTYVEGKYWAHNTALYVKDMHGNHPRFVYYVMQLLDFQKYTSGASVPTLNRNFIHPALLPLPKLEEQIRIASILDTIVQKRDKAGEIRGNLTELFKSMLQQLMTGAIRVNKVELQEIAQQE